MKLAKLVLITALVALGCVLAVVLTEQPGHEPRTIATIAPKLPTPAPLPPALAVPPQNLEVATVTQETTVSNASIVVAVEPAATNRHGLKKLAGKKASKPKAPIQDPDARVALSLVGIDPDAEDYWISAINDPTLPPEERKDLIEDLNETGLANPHQPGADDLPIIASRLQLIEALASNPNFVAGLDQVNKDAFAEAHKDLVNLLAGKPAD